MANIRVELSQEIIDGQPVTFVAPCDCTAIDGLKVYYPGGAKVFVFKDAHGNILTGIGNLFAAGAYVKAILDVSSGSAYIQNADTNAYLEAQLASKRPNTWMPTASDVGAVPTSRTINGKALSGNISLSASDVKARSDTWVPSASQVSGQTDYVVASGTSGVWSYWKFNSGLCIAMGIPTVTWGTTTQIVSGQSRSTAALSLSGIFTAVMGGTCSNVHRYVNCFVVPSGSTSAELWATTAVANATAPSSNFSTTPMVVLFGKWK